MAKFEPLPDFNPQEVSFNSEAARSYLFTAAVHMLEGMMEQNISHAPVAVMTGALEFAAQLWMWTAIRQGVPIQKARQTAEREFRTFLIRHSKSKPAEGMEGEGGQAS